MSLIQKIVQQDDLMTAALIDPVTKFRVSTPESMIQTDFEYGLQPTKWESIELVNNIPVFYVKDGDVDIPLVFVKTFENSYIVNVRSSVPHNFVAGSPFVVTGLSSLTAEGTYIVYSVVDDYEFYYRAKQAQQSDADVYDSYTTYLYSARIFSATQYNMDNLIAVETTGIKDRTETFVTEPESSTITVITQFPHGFVKGSTFMMGNSLGEKNVDFNAKLIDVNGIVTETIVINTASNNPTGSGYLTKVLNPYEFQSKRTYFIDLADVNYTNNYITVPNHGLVTGNCLMYVSPISDTPIGGMQNYKLYYINVLSPNQIQLSNIEPFLYAGLDYKRYMISTGTTTIGDTKKPFTLESTSLMDFTGYVPSKSYRVGSTDQLTLRYVAGTALGAVGGPAFTSGAQAAFSTWNTTSGRPMLDLEGYFYTTYTGQHRLKIISTDIAYLWIGSNATSYEFNKSKTYGNTPTFGDNTQTVTRAWTGTKFGTAATYRSNELILTLNSNDMVPIKVRFANRGTLTPTTEFELSYKLPYFGNLTNTCLSGCNVGSFTGAGGAGHMDYALAGKSFFYSLGRYESSVGIGTTLGSTYIGNGTDPKAYYKFTPVILADGVATEKYGVHSFHKSYLVNGFIHNPATTSRTVYSTGSVNICYNPTANDGQGASSASLIKGGKVAFFSGDVISRREGFGLTELPGTINNYGGYASNTYNLANVEVTVSTTPISTSTTKVVATNNFYPTTDVTFSVLPKNYDGYKLNSVAWVVPVTDVSLKNSIYYPSHGITTDDVIIFGNVGWGSLPKGIVSQIPYYAEVPDINYLRIKTKKGITAAYDLNEFTNANFNISRTASNVYNRDKNRIGAYRIYAEGHDFTSNTPVSYYPYVDGTNVSSLTGITKNVTYYVCKPYSDSFQLAGQKHGPALQILHNITDDEYHSIRAADRGTVDGNFEAIDGITDASTMKFTANYGIPYTRKYFNPRAALDLQSNLFYIPDHRLRTGSRVIYGISNNGAGGPIPKLSDGSSYLTIRVDENRFRLSTVDISSIIGTEGIVSAPSFIDAWNYANTSPMEYISFNQEADPYPYDRNDQGAYHFFDFATIGGDTPYPKPLILANSCNLIQNSNIKQGIDFTSVTKLGGLVGVRYPDRSNIYTVAAVGTTNVSTEIILNGSYTNFKDGDTIVYNKPSSARGLGGLSNGYFYYVSGVTGIGTTQTRITYLYNTSNSAVNTDTSYHYTGWVGINTSTNGGSFSKRFAGQIDYYTITDINSKNVVTVERDIVLPSWLSSPNASGQLMVSTGIYPRLDSYIEHRAYNGGVEIVPSLCPYTRITRQTRKYFRYQAGKGIQLSKAINFSAPVKFSYLKIQTDSSGIYYNKLIGKTRSPHRLNVGVSIRIDNATSTGSTDYWNGEYSVLDISSTDPTVFYLLPKFDPVTDKVNPPFAGGFPEFVVNGWEKDSSYLRVGMFDDQNGIFFEYDGQDLNAVRRNSTQQLAGTANVEYNSSLITGNNTAFDSSRPHLDVGSMIVIRGVSYKVVNILNDQYMYVQPPYRGVTAKNVIVSLTKDTKVPSSQFSIDKCDGTGPTGFDFDVHKIQMMYIDFSWYGAGKVRYGFKAVDGEVKYVHEFIHNNIFTEAYMRAGNLPGRYEVGNGANPTFAPALQHWGTSIIMDGRQDTDKEYIFTASGKQINYYNKDTTEITIHPSTTTAGSFIYKLGYNISYLGGSNVPGGTFISATPELYDPTQDKTVSAYTLWFGPSSDSGAAALFSHLKLYGPGTDIVQTSGTAFFPSNTKLVAYPELVDGYYYMYVNRQPISTTLLPTAKFKLGSGTDSIPSLIPLVSIRLSPCVDNGRPALLGQREVVNRMQLELDSVSTMVSHDCEIQLILNGNPFYKNYSRLPTPSLTQAIFHEKYDSIQGGLPIYTIRAAGGAEDANGRRNTTLTNTELKNVATLGNSIIGGNGTYPDGPDLLTIAAKPLSINNVGVYRPLTVSARISWKEAQA